MSTYLASKPRYEILDGLRGVAAMMVVAFHLFETYFHMGPDQPINHGFWICSLAVVVLLAMPRVGGADEQNFWMNGAYEAFSILIMFPLILAVGAGSEIKGNASKKICAFLGDISYPLYITHYPLIYWQMSWAATHQDLPASTHVFFAVSIFVIAIGIAYASLKLYDLPVRVWLRKKWF